jgi:hypothetical protein
MLCGGPHFRSSASVFSRIAYSISGMPHRQQKTTTTKTPRRINGSILINTMA